MIQAQILELLERLKRELDLSMILISHDLSVMAETCDSMAIMYAGKIVERGSVRDVYKDAKHPYTKDLIGAFPDIEGPQTLPAYIPIRSFVYGDRKSTRLNSSHVRISYAVFCLKKKQHT